MKPIIAFYERLSDLIETGVKAVRTADIQAGVIENDLVRLFGKARASKNPVSWVGAEISSILSMMLKCVNDNENSNNKQWELSVETLMTSAFKDLSAVRDPEALQTFARLRRVCFMDKKELFLWSRKRTEREDGSAVIVLHVSNLRAFESLIHVKNSKGSLEEGMIIQD